MTEAPQGLDELVSFLRKECEDADSYYDTLETLTDQAFRYYEAQPFGNEIEGRSQIVLPDVQETIDYMQQSVLRAFVSGDRAVEFEATDQADEQAADDATAALNYNFMRQQDGYRILYDGLFDGLLRKLGVFKTVAETEEKTSTEQIIVGSEEELALMVDRDDGKEGRDKVEVLAYVPQLIADDATGEHIATGNLVADIKRTKLVKRFVDYAVPLSEFRFSPKARHEDTAAYLAHVCEKTRSELVEMGFDQDQVYDLPMHGNAPAIPDAESVLDYHRASENSKAAELVLLHEEYALADIDGDGIAERVKVFRVEDQILIDAETGEPAVEQVDEHPFAVFCPFPRSHRMVGYSLADKVMHIQYQRTFVGRQLFDGLALSNMPRPVVDTAMADMQTYQDILSPIPGSPIRVKGGLSSVQPWQSSFDPAKSLAVMEWITGERESLTGITRLNQGLDADALNKTATGTAMMQVQGQQNEEAIARQFAECIGRLFGKKYRLMKAEGEPFRIKVDGQYKQVDPRQWPDEVNMIVRVGLGSNSKDKRIQYRMAMSQPLANAIQSGFAGPEHVFNWFDGMARDTGLGQGDEFVYDPANSPERPDPAAAAMQAEQQAKQAELQLKAQEAEAKIALDREKNAATIETMREKHALDMQLAREKAAQEAQLARERMVMEAQLEDQRMRLDAAHKAQMDQNRPGGALNA
ncbi:portal protein [Alteraurantiacibacter buctensis]|uniref:Phage portal protein n=1 Tax=Alteraurantiacibacter buctensis TaxID=1503981 RepID=A0A844Z0K6_9SPHN|nr:hypothetical protein [Alteraurantiacibacter buctensis]MXO72878.1 hypothetical protein [Alteraurantiacibacter buctensis]